MTSTAKRLVRSLVAVVTMAIVGWALHEARTTSGGNAGSDAAPAVAPRGSDGSERAAQELAVLRDELAQLRAELRELRGVGRAVEVAPRPARRVSAPTDRPLDREERADADAELVEREPESARPLAQLEAEHGAEPRDRAWSERAEELITRAFDADSSAAGEHGAGLSGSEVESIDCRSTVCRVDVTHADTAALADFLHDFPSRVGSELPRVALEPRESGNDTLTTVVFLRAH
jgi:hypothetical protein